MPLKITTNKLRIKNGNEYQNIGILENELNLSNYVVPEMFGAVGDGTTDDTSPIINAINEAILSKKTLYLGSRYAFSEPITIQNSINIERSATGSLVYIGSTDTGYAVTFDGGLTEKIRGVSVNLKLTHATDLYGIGGLQIKNCLHNEFSLIVSGFSTGVNLIGDSYDCDYNLVHLIAIENNRINLHLNTNGASGAVNQNTFIGGSLRIDSGTVSLLENDDHFSDLIIETSSNHIPNNNTFIGVSFESTGENWINVNGYYNSFINCRLEGITSLTVSGYGTTVIGGFGFDTVPSALGDILFLDRNVLKIPVENNPLSLKRIGSASKFLEFRNSSNSLLSYFDSSGSLTLNSSSVINLNANAHDNPIVFDATATIPSLTGRQYGSLNINSASGYSGKRLRIRDGDEWKNVLYSYAESTSNRPTGIDEGYMMFDTTLGKPIWYKGSSKWVDATGTEV